MTKNEAGELDFEEPEEEAEGAARGTLYITRAGAERLREELRRLATEERPKVTAEVAYAASLGDRSENAEYIYGKRRLREIDRRLHFLHKRLEKLTVVEAGAQADRSRVYFGATVTLRNEEEGTTVSYTLVGPDEIDLPARRISVDSPVGRALLGKRAGDEVVVHRPKGEAEFTIVEISYR